MPNLPNEESPPPSLVPAHGFDARVNRLSMIAVTLVATIAAAWVASALWAGLLFGLLTAFAVEPLQPWLLVRLPGKRRLTAAILVVGLALVSGVLLAAAAVLLVNEILSSAHALREALRTFSADSVLSPSVKRTLATVGVTPDMVAARAISLADRAAEIATGFASVVLGSTLSWVGGTLIALLTAYHTLKDGNPIERRFESVLPLHPRLTRELMGEFRRVGRGIFIGTVLAAFAQGAIATLGYAIMGVPRALLLGFATFIASFIPVIGTFLVWVPASVVLMFTGHLGAGIFELIWGVLLTTSLVDYVLRPMLAGKESRSHPCSSSWASSAASRSWARPASSRAPSSWRSSRRPSRSTAARSCRGSPPRRPRINPQSSRH